MQKSQQLKALKNKVLNKNIEWDLLDVYHYLMVHYGYIPFEDFKKMDANLVNELVDRISKMNEKGSKK